MKILPSMHSPRDWILGGAGGMGRGSLMTESMFVSDFPLWPRCRILIRSMPFKIVIIKAMVSML